MTHKLLIYLAVGLTLLGLGMVADASPVTAVRDFGDQWYYLKLQSLWAAFGLAGFLIASRFPHRHLEKWAPALFGLTLILLIAVLIPGIGTQIKGARRWLSLGAFSFQPAEFAKLTTATYLAALFKSRPRFLHLLVIASILGVLVMLEPDMGTSLVILGMCLVMYFGRGGPIRHLLLVAPAAAAIIAGLIFISPYRAARLNTFFNLAADPLGASYQVHQALISLGSGGIFGVGLGQSRQKYDFLPEVTTDSIFAVVGEEIGLVGTTALLTAFLILTLAGLHLAKTTHSVFSASLALGLASWLGIQSFINMSAVAALLPFTGIPLPFISYGGSALLVTLTAAGILVNISKIQK